MDDARPDDAHSDDRKTASKPSNLFIVLVVAIVTLAIGYIILAI